MAAPAHNPGPRYPRDFGDLLSSVFSEVGRSLRDVIPAVAVALSPGLAIWMIVLAIVGDTSEWVVTQPDGTAEFVGDSADVWLFGFGMLTAWIVLLLAQTVAQAATIRIMLAREAGQPVAWLSAVRTSVRQLGSLLLISFLAGFAILGGLILCIIPGIVLWIGFTVMIPAFVVEDTRGTAALKRSWQLLKGRKGTVLGLLVVVGLAGLAVNFFLSIVQAILTAPGGWMLDLVVATLAMLVTMIVGISLNAGVANSCYADARAREDLARSGTTGDWPSSTRPPPPPLLPPIPPPPVPPEDEDPFPRPF